MSIVTRVLVLVISTITLTNAAGDPLDLSIPSLPSLQADFALDDQGNAIVNVVDREPIDFATDYVSRVRNIISAMEEHNEIDLTQVRDLTYIAPAPNQFFYSPSEGMQWNPALASSIPEKNPAFTMIDRPERKEDLTAFAHVFSRKEFGWIVSKYGITSDDGGDNRASDQYRIAVPIEVARELYVPFGYEWRAGPIEQVPRDYRWFAPQSWTALTDTSPNAPKLVDRFEWGTPELQYRITMDTLFLEHYSELVPYEQDELIGGRVWDSIVGQYPDTLIQK